MPSQTIPAFSAGQTGGRQDLTCGLRSLNLKRQGPRVFRGQAEVVKRTGEEEQLAVECQLLLPSEHGAEEESSKRVIH